ncbi:MAG: glycosyltransferase [Streptomycetaceae bacterium]|nr:glycosyltransferase [Streptomycetaceae bacterium]
MRVVLDGQVTGADGIARATRHLAAALMRLAPEAGLSLTVIPPSGTPRYSQAEGDHLLAAARRHHADVLHLLDYRIPLAPAPLPLVATVHDLLRLIRPQHCYTDQQFARRFGPDRLDLLAEATRALRTLTPPPPGALRFPASWHEEFYGLMTAYTAATATAVITPTRTVADHLAEAVGYRVPTVIAPWGVDHLPASAHGAGPLPKELRPGGYLLYVGQARSHKGLPCLLAAYAATRAAQRGMRLALAGRDFTTGFADSADLPPGTTLLGEVDDTQLAHLYMHAAALVHLAEHEGFGFPPLEALSFGTRVLVADLPVLRETLGRHAYFTDPAASPAATARTLDHLLDEPDSDQQRRSRAAWAARYRWDTCARHVIDCYRKALT